MQNHHTVRYIGQDAIGVAIFLLILFGIAVVVVAGCFFRWLIDGRLGAKPGSTLQARARSAFQAADPAWLALVCGPLFCALVAAIEVAFLLFRSDGAPSHPERENKLFGIVRTVSLMVGVGAIAGAMLAGAFWASSSLFGRVRKAPKRLQGVYDPDFDGP